MLNFPSFLGGGGGVRVTGLSENLGTCLFYSKYYIFFELKVFKAQMGYGGRQICTLQMFSEGF